MVMNSSALDGAIDEAVTEVATAEFFMEAMLTPSLYNMRPSTGPRETVQSFGELADWEVKSEGAEMSTDQVIQQFQKIFVQKTYGKVLEMTEEFIEDDRWDLAQDFAEQLGSTASQTFERLGAAVFNDAFAGATYKGEDALPLCDNAHLNADSGNSQDNSGTNALDHPGAKTTRRLMRDFTGYESTTILGIIPNEILVSNEQEEEGFALLESTLKPGSQDNDANIFRGRYTLYVWDWLTDANAWFMMASRLRQRYLRWYVRRPLRILSDASWSKGVRRVGGSFRIVHGFTNWRWIYGNNPS